VLPVAHIGHYLWVLYLLPVAIVVAGIIKSTRAAQRRESEED
jgi:cytochrome c-type biogenesis protein CcmH/NrfF